MKYAESWYCNENCLYEYIKDNEAEIAEILKEDGLDHELFLNENNDIIPNSDKEGDLNYDPMDDF